MRALLLLIALVLGSPSLAAEREINLVRIAGSTRTAIDAIALTKIYHAIGITLNVTALPSLRAEQMANTGQFDGEVGRVAAYAATHPSMLRVDPELSVNTYVALWLSANQLNIKSKQDLAQYKLAHVSGIKGIEEIVTGFPSITTTNNDEVLFKNLLSKRIEVALMNKKGADRLLAAYERPEISMLEVGSQASYHFLHEKNRALLPLISAKLQALKKSGHLQGIMAQAEAEFLASGVPP